MDLFLVIQAILLALFGALTVVLNTVIGPFYDNVFVPEMAPQSLYAAYLGGGSSSNLFATGATLSQFVVVNLVDPMAILIVIGVGVLYLVRATLPERAQVWRGLAPRLVLGVLLSNVVLPLTYILWSIALLVYQPLFAYGGGAWQSYNNLVPTGGISFAWDNGVIAFIVTLMLLTLVLGLGFLIAFRDALLAVLLVLLPPLTLLWPIPPLSGFARRAWRLFGEMAFLPTLVVIPLVLAVGAPSILLVAGLLAVAVGAPSLLSQVGGNLVSLGFPHPGSMTTSGMSGGYDRSTRASGALLRSGQEGFSNSFRSSRPDSTTGAGTNGVSGKGSGGKGAGAMASKSAGSARNAQFAGAAGGPTGVVAMVAWGAGNAMGRAGRIVMDRMSKRDAPQVARASSPRPLPSSQQVRKR